MNMSNKTFHVLTLNTFVFNKCSEIIIFTIIFVVKSKISLKGFDWNNVGPAAQTVLLTVLPLIQKWAANLAHH